MFFAATFCFRPAFVDAIVDMAIRVFTEGIIFSVVIVLHIQLGGSRLSSHKLKLPKLYLNLCLPLGRSFCSRLASFLFSRQRHVPVLLPSLITFADICSGFWVHPKSDMAAADNAFVGTSCVLRFPPPYSADEFNRR